jgi:hypothetical protein
MDKPRVAYGADFVTERFRMMQHVHQTVKVNLEDAQECSKRYYDKMAKERSFLPGDKVMVFFTNAPPIINPKFFSHWVPNTVVQMVGKANAQVRNKETGKSSIIHLDRIKELREDLEENEETAGMQQGQQQGMRARPTVASHAKENAGEQHEEARVFRGTAGAAVLTQRQDMQEEHEGARVARGTAGAAAAVLAQDQDIREQVEAEQGKKPRTKPKKRKQPKMQSGWLPRVDHAGEKGVRLAQWAYKSTTWTIIGLIRPRKGGGCSGQKRATKRSSEFRDYPDYMHVSWPAGPTEAEQEADWFFNSATSGPAWPGWQPDSGQAGPEWQQEEGPEADFFTAEAGQLLDILGAHTDFLPGLEPIKEE